CVRPFIWTISLMRVSPYFRCPIVMVMTTCLSLGQDVGVKRRPVVEFAEASFLQVIFGGGQILTGRIERAAVVSANADIIQGEITLDEIRSITPGESLAHRLTVGFAQYGRPEAR